MQHPLFAVVDGYAGEPAPPVTPRDIPRVIEAVDRIADAIAAECAGLPDCDVVDQLTALSRLLPRAARLGVRVDQPALRAC